MREVFTPTADIGADEATGDFDAPRLSSESYSSNPNYSACVLDPSYMLTLRTLYSKTWF